MKKSTIILTIAAALLAVNTRAQPDTNQTTLDNLLQHVPGMTNGAVNLYATYAPQAPNNDKWGGGVLGIWNVNNQSDSVIKVGLGAGLDWLGQLSMVSVDGQISAPFHPWASKFPTLIISPVAIGGGATAYSGNGKFNGAMSTVSDVGGYLAFGHLWGGDFDAGCVWGQWTGAGPYDVKRYHAFIGWKHGF